MGTPAVVLLAAVTCVGGWLLGRATSSPEPALPALQAPEVAADPAIGELAREVRRLSERVDALVQAQSPRTPLASNGESEAAARLDAVVRELGGLIAALGAIAPESAFDPTAKVASNGATPARHALQDSIVRRLEAAPTDETYFAEREVATVELLANHRLWTLPQILARYGTPDQVNGGDSGLYVRYDFSDPRNDRQFFFQLCEGYVVDAQFHVSR